MTSAARRGLRTLWRRLASIDPSWVLGAIVLLALAVRLAAIGTRLNNDDAYSWWVASAPSPHGFLSRLAASENTPPLFYVLLTPLPIDHPAWLRSPAALAGVLMCVALYCALRGPFGARAALLAALAVAVAPFLITDSNLGRGFTLEDLALLVALWAVLRLGERASRRWWIAFVLAAVVALYTEYDSAIFLVGLSFAALWTGRPARRPMIIASAVPFAALTAWIPEMVRSQQRVGVTKLNPINGATSLTALRDAIVTLVFGEHGGTASSGGRWLEAVVIIAVGVAAAVVLRRGWDSRPERFRTAVVVLALTAAVTVLGHALAGAVGIQIFTQRYLTILIAIAAALGAAAVVSVELRGLGTLIAVALVALGLGNLVRRLHGEYQPDLTPVRAAAVAAHPRTILTDTPLVLYYLRSLHPVMDRPYNLGRGLTGSCERPCLVIDDSRVTGGTERQVSGARSDIGPFVLALER